MLGKSTARRVALSPDDAVPGREVLCEWVRGQGIDPEIVSTSTTPSIWRNALGLLRFTYLEVLRDDDGKSFICGGGGGEGHVAVRWVEKNVSSAPPGVKV